MARELKFAGMLLHQFFEAPERNNFPEGRMHSFCPRLGMKNSRSFIGELRIEPYRCHGYSHELSPSNKYIYIITNMYIHGKEDWAENGRVYFLSFFIVRLALNRYPLAWE
jgi:hypothetical protein